MDELITFSELIDKLITVNIKLYNLLENTSVLDRKPVKSKEPVREKSTRIRKPNSMLRDFVGNGLNEIIIGGVIHKL